MRDFETRTHDLLTLSDRVYDAIDQDVHGETRARRILRLGMQVVADSIETSYGNGLVAGDYLHALLHHELVDGGLPRDAYVPWKSYLPPPSRFLENELPFITDTDLDALTVAYADVTRATIDRGGNFETDASHVVHLMALALPYAAEYHPDLDQSKIAIYCLIHDIVEAYAGDTASLGASVQVLAEKAVREHESLARITRELTPQYPKLVALIHDYENLADDEAKYVKTFDKLDPKFTLGYSQGISLTRDYKISQDEYAESMRLQRETLAASYGREFLDLLRIQEVLTEIMMERINWTS